MKRIFKDFQSYKKYITKNYFSQSLKKYGKMVHKTYNN